MTIQVSSTGGGGMAIGGTVTGGTTGSILFVGAGPVLAQDNANLFWDDTGDQILLGGTSAAAANTILGASGATIFNEQGADVDFRVEGDTATHMIIVDASENKIGFNTPNALQTDLAEFELSGTASTLGVIRVDRIATGTQTGGSIGYEAAMALQYGANSANLAYAYQANIVDNAVAFGNTSEIAGFRSTMTASGANTWTNVYGLKIDHPNGASHTMTTSTGVLVNLTNAGTVGTAIGLHIDNVEGTSQIAIQSDEGACIFNDDGGDHNFRIESSNQENMFFLDAGTDRIGLATGSPEATLHLANVTTNQDGVKVDYYGDTGTGVLEMQRARGSLGTPTTITSGTALGRIQTGGYDGTGFQAPRGKITFGGTETWNATSAGMEIIFNVVANTTTTQQNCLVLANNGDAIFSSSNLGAAQSPSGQVEIEQQDTSGAQPVLYLQQSDVSEDFIRFQGTAAAATLTQSIVAEGDVTTATRQGFVKVHVIDDGNQITDQDYFMPIFTLT